MDQLTVDIDRSSKPKTEDVEIKNNVSFSEMMLSSSVLTGLTKNGFVKPSPIQLRAIPLGKTGLDLLIKAKSGTGKTLVFCTVILERFDNKVNGPQSLIIVPTREVALQIESYLNGLGQSIKGFKAVCAIGGRDVNEDRRRVNKCSSIVGTPGRLLHLLNNNVIQTKQIKLLVLDEADKLLSMGFRNNINAVLSLLNRNQQIIASSATYADDLDKLLLSYMKNPIAVSATRDAPILLGIKQFLYDLDEINSNSSESTAKIIMKKIECIENILTNVSFKQCIAFSNSQLRAESYHNYLLQRGWTVDVILGSQEQNVRTSTFTKFKSFQSRILIASDLMARGVDIDNVNLVINLDVPIDSSTYLHRIGRCGRFGSHGIAITFVANVDDSMKFRKLLGNIGGANMKVLKFPNKSKIDNNAIWDFANRLRDGQIFGEVNAFVENDFCYKQEGAKCDNSNNDAEKESGFLKILKTKDDAIIDRDLLEGGSRSDQQEACLNGMDEDPIGAGNENEVNISNKQNNKQKPNVQTQNIVDENLELLEMCKMMIGDSSDKVPEIEDDIFADYNDRKNDVKETQKIDYIIAEDIFASYDNERNVVDLGHEKSSHDLDSQTESVKTIQKDQNAPIYRSVNAFRSNEGDTSEGLDQTIGYGNTTLKLKQSEKFNDSNLPEALNNIFLGSVATFENSNSVGDATNPIRKKLVTGEKEQKASSRYTKSIPQSNIQNNTFNRSNGSNLWLDMYKAQMDQISYYVKMAQRNSAFSVTKWK